jgi:hypothetical protein
MTKRLHGLEPLVHIRQRQHAHPPTQPWPTLSPAPQDIDGRSTKMDKFKGKVCLVVNLASACGFTPQYTELQELYKKYGSKGFTVLGFPVSSHNLEGVRIDVTA